MRVLWPHAETSKQTRNKFFNPNFIYEMECLCVTNTVTSLLLFSSHDSDRHVVPFCERATLAPSESQKAPLKPAGGCIITLTILRYADLMAALG